MLQIKLRRFFQNVALFTGIAAVMLCVASVRPVLADDACGVGSLTGTCKYTCNDTEIDVKFITAELSDITTDLKLTGTCNKVCCVPKGPSLCGGVAGYAKLDGNYTCVASCTGKSLLQAVSGIGEMCAAGSSCCLATSVSGSAPAKAAGAPSSPGSATTLENPLGAGTTIVTILNRVITAFLGIVGALALAVFVYAGVTYMTAGSSDRVKQATEAMKAAVIGLALIAFSYAITTFFINAFTRGG